MKKLIYSALIAASALPAMAAINTVNYQALIRDNAGKPVAEKEIGVRFRVVAEDGFLYEEKATVKTDASGLITYEIGSVNPEDFAAIDWSVEGGTKLEVSYDLNGGSNYTSTLEGNINSVPTALRALTSDDAAALKAPVEAATADIADLKNRAENYENAFNKVKIQIEEQANNASSG